MANPDSATAETPIPTMGIENIVTASGASSEDEATIIESLLAATTNNGEIVTFNYEAARRAGVGERSIEEYTLGLGVESGTNWTARAACRGKNATGGTPARGTIYLSSCNAEKYLDALRDRVSKLTIIGIFAGAIPGGQIAGALHGAAAWWLNENAVNVIQKCATPGRGIEISYPAYTCKPQP